LGRPVMTPPPASPSGEPPLSSKQTPLQRHLAHLARHGINAVASAPGDAASDSLSAESPHNSFVNVASSLPAAAQQSGASVVTSNLGSLGSIGGSIKGRFSRFGSLNFGKKR
jgi:dedicator of cytokinesis protein 3